MEIMNVDIRVACVQDPTVEVQGLETICRRDKCTIILDTWGREIHEMSLLYWYSRYLRTLFAPRLS